MRLPTSHVFDEAHDVAALSEVAGEVNEGVVVDSFLHDGVDLDWAETGGFGGGDAFEDAPDAEAASVHLAEYGVVERVEAHGDAVQAGVAERGRLLRQQVGVGGHGEVANAVDVRKHRHKLLYLGAYQRLAAGETHLDDAKLREDASQAGNLLEGEQVRFLQGTRTARRISRRACSRCSGSCSGRLRRCGGLAAAV